VIPLCLVNRCNRIGMDRSTVEVKHTSDLRSHATSLADLYKVPVLPPVYGFQTYIMYP